MFCKYLDHQVCIRTSGEFRLCCASLEPSHDYNIKTHTIEQWLDSDIHKQARESIKNGVFPDACIRCKNDEENNIQSMRQRTEVYGPGLSHLDIRFNNQCNLRCVMCNPMSSSSLLQEHNSFVGDKPWGQIEAVEYNWYTDDIAEQLSKISTLKEVYLTGGEPFMVRGLDKFISKLDRSVKLRFNTNGTLNNPKLFELLREFEYVNLAFSIDGIGKVNDYIRFGSNWPVIEKNLHMARDYGFDVSITPTIQVYNYPYLNELYTYCDKHDFKHFDNLLITPTHLDIRYMPKTLIEQHMLPQYIDYFNFEYNQSEVDKFKRYTKLLDNNRHVDIRDYLPLVAEHYDFS